VCSRSKKTPLTLAHADEFSKLLPKRADSPASWTVDHSTRFERAREEARPHLEKAAELDARLPAILDKAFKGELCHPHFLP
jgi:hypothetical protein